MPFSYFDTQGVPRAPDGSVWGGEITLGDTIPEIIVKGVPIVTTYDTSNTEKSFGDSLLDTLLLGPKLLVNGLSRQIDGLSDPRLQGAVVVNPNDPRYNNYGVPLIAGPPGAGIGPGSGFLNQPVFGSVTGGQAALGIAALLAVVLIAKASG